jgi:hypothetical protein
MQVNLPNTSSYYTDPSRCPTGGKYRKWRGSDPRHYSEAGKIYAHPDMGAVMPEKINGKWMARTTGISEKRVKLGDIGAPQGPALKWSFKKLWRKLF